MVKFYHFLLLGFFLFASIGHSYGQQPAGATPLRATSDTTRAVSTMFGKHRTGGIVWTTIGALFTGRILGAGLSQGNAGGTLVGIAVFGGVPAAIGISKLSRFSKSREEEVLAQYAKHKTLPRYVSKRLKSKYFR